MVPTVEQLCGNITFKQDFNSTAHFNSHNMSFTLLESITTISNEQCFLHPGLCLAHSSSSVYV